MSSIYGNKLKLSVFGQSHAPAIGMTLDGIPAGLPLNMEILQKFLARRAPGQNGLSTPRRESDIPEILCGIMNGFTCGAPISAVIRNTNTRSQDYANLRDCPRPGHADYTAQIKHHGFQDAAGGGHFSGRLTAPLCIAGGMCLQWLAEKGIHIGAHIVSIENVRDTPFDMVCPQLDSVRRGFPVLSQEAGEAMQAAILNAKAVGDSVGGVIECAITGVPAGVGDPMFDGIENRIAQIVFGIPAVKGLEFGLGFGLSGLRGSVSNDPFTIQNGTIATATNHCGGILGGISDGMPILFRAAVKPTPSIAREQQSVSIRKLETQALTIEGRHDPCIVPRAVPVVEAAAAIAMMDMLL